MSKISFRFVRLAAYIVVVLTALIVSIAVLGFRSVIDQSLMNQCETVFNVLESDIEARKQETYSVANNLAANSQIIKGITSSNSDILSTGFSSMSVSDGIFVAFANEDGEMIWRSDNVVGVPDFSSALNEETTTDLYGEGSSALYFQTSIPVYYGNILVGSLVVGYDLSNTSFVDGIKEKTGNEVTIFAGDIRLNTTVLNENGERGVGTQLASNIAEQVIQGGQSYSGEATVLGQNMLTQYGPLTNASGEVLGAIFTGQSTKNIDHSFMTIMTLLILVALVIGAIALFVLARVTRNVIIKPIVSIKNLMQHVKEGNLRAEMEPFRRNHDELGELAGAIEETVQKLDTYVTDISTMLNAMAACDFSKSSDVVYVGEFEAIQTAMKEIETNIKEVILSLQETSEQLQRDITSISAGAEKLAQGATEQAATISDFMASLENVSKQIADHAQKANRAKALSDDVSQKMRDEETTVNNMRLAMGEIERKSNEIFEIIKTIEDIAFQTNILALNAAVEAARAGNAGKGFAVVAEEVRNLAAHSAKAAATTTSLIETTISAVESGVKYTEGVSESLLHVKDTALKTNILMEEIDQVTSEQAESLSQIADNMGQISTVVSQNSATAEESSASCHQLDRQFVELKNIIEKFKI